MRRAPLAALLLLCGCSAQVSIETKPIARQAVPITSLREPVYVELAIDLPDVTTGDLRVDEVSADLVVVNPTGALDLEAEMRVSLTGQAQPNQPLVHSRLNVPAYWSTATQVFPKKTYRPNTSTPERLQGQALTAVVERALARKRLYLIVANTANTASVDPRVVPAEMRLENIVLRATVTKPFTGIGGALDVTGL